MPNLTFRNHPCYQQTNLPIGLILSEPDGLNSKESPAHKDDYDSPWKEALEQSFKGFVALYTPELHDLVDWSQGYTALDGELQSMGSNSKRGRKLVDKLMQVHLKDGSSAILLIHIEVEHSINSPKQLKALGARMLEYYMFLALKHPETRIYSIAVVIDMSDSAAALLKAADKPYMYSNQNSLSIDAAATIGTDVKSDKSNKLQSMQALVNSLPRHTFTAGTNVLDCALRFTLPIVNLKEWLNHEQTLAAMARANPFAVITLAQLAALKYKKDKAKRLQPKMELVRQLQSHGYQQDTIIMLFRLIDWLITLPEQLQDEFSQFLYTTSAEQSMSYVTPYEQFIINKVKDDFVKIGHKDGVQDGQTDLLLRLLNRKFKSVPESVAERIKNASQEQLEMWSLNFVDANTLDDVFG